MKRAEPQITESRFKKIFLVLFVVAVVVGVLAVYYTDFSSLNSREGELEVWFFDVGQGESVFIETPEGQQILIDGGPDTSVLRKLGLVMPPWDRSIDAVFLTHPHADHVTGINHVLQRYEVGAVYETGARTYTDTVEVYEQNLVSRPLEHEIVMRGFEKNFGEMNIEVLWPQQKFTNEYPEDPNRSSLVLLLDYNDSEVLFTGDAYVEDEERFVGEVGDIDVLKVGHSGSRTSTSNTLLAQTQPESAVISVGRKNSYGHPHPVVVRRLLDAGIKVWRTDHDGDVKMTSDGKVEKLNLAPLPF